MSLPGKKESENMDFGSWSDFGKFLIWRVNFESEVSSGASRSFEAMFLINEVESAKPAAELKTYKKNHWSRVADLLRGS